MVVSQSNEYPTIGPQILESLLLGAPKMVPLILGNPQILAAQVLLHLHVGRVEEDGHCYSPALDSRIRFR